MAEQKSFEIGSQWATLHLIGEVHHMISQNTFLGAMHVDTFTEAHNPGEPRSIGSRYNAHGFLPEAGNTVICHLDRTDPTHAAILECRRSLMLLPGADTLLFTPEDSLHMTVFEGTVDTRRHAGAWPEGIALDAGITEVTDALLPRLEAFESPGEFKVKLRGISPGELALEGATDADEQTLRAWRDALTTPFGYRQAHHDSYQFHMTLAYPVTWLPDELAPIWSLTLDDFAADLARKAPVIPLRPTAFCSFGDMTHFEELLVLGTALRA
ncbi:MAG: DUF1868 domain-containing protein [Marinovum sp.]|nr:DUF1868 domain-containing protein [Marinovum sp.]